MVNLSDKLASADYMAISQTALQRRAVGRDRSLNPHQAEFTDERLLTHLLKWARLLWQTEPQ